MIVAADYARTVAHMESAALPAYVSYIEHGSSRGLAGYEESPKRIYVRISDGTIVIGAPQGDVRAVGANVADTGNPFSKKRFLDPHCYTPKNENRTNWNGRPALRFELDAACKESNGFTELYADPQTLQPIAVDGNVSDAEDPLMVTSIEVRYTTVGAYTVPSNIRAHAAGHG